MLMDIFPFCKKRLVRRWLFESEIFRDTYYDLNFRKNRNLRKPLDLPKTEDVKMLMDK